MYLCDSTLHPISTGPHHSESLFPDGLWVVQYENERDLLVSGSRDTTIKLWSIKSQMCTHTLSGHTGAPLLPISSLLVISSVQKLTLYMIMINRKSAMPAVGRQQNRFWIGRLFDQGLLLFSYFTYIHTNNHNFMVALYLRSFSLSCHHSFQIWDLKTMQCVNTLRSHSSRVWCLQFDETRSNFLSSFFLPFCIPCSIISPFFFNLFLLLTYHDGSISTHICSNKRIKRQNN